MWSAKLGNLKEPHMVLSQIHSLHFECQPDAVYSKHAVMIGHCSISPLVRSCDKESPICGEGC